MLGEPFQLGFLSQTIPTTPGTMYQVSLWLNCDGSGPNEFQFKWNGTTVYDQANIAALSDWTNLQFSVTATGTSTTVQFGFRDDSEFLGLDDVSVVPVPVTLPAPTLQSVAKVGNSVQFSWTSVSGLVYQLQYTTNVGHPNWSNLGAGLTATNSTTTLMTPITTDPQRFFRVQVLP